MNVLRVILRATSRTASYGWNVLAPALGIPRPLFAISSLLLLYWMAKYAYVALVG